MIGVIDSGSGGLSVLLELKKQFPQADFLYYGDIKNAPYGEKTHAELSRLTVDALKFLKDNRVTNVVSACNSVSASMAISLLDTLLSAQHIVEMVGPTVQSFLQDTRRVAVCATQATIDSGMYQNAFHMIDKEITTIAIPDLAGQIEFGATEEDIKNTITKAISAQSTNYDVLVLACTHYPLVQNVFRSVLNDSIEIIDPAHAVAARAKKLFKDEEGSDGKVQFVITKDAGSFRNRVEELFADQRKTIEVLP